MTVAAKIYLFEILSIRPQHNSSLTTETKKAWLLLIRSAKEATIDAPIDGFSHNDILRELIGLDPIGRAQAS